MMSTPDVVRLLAVISTFDNRRVEEATVAAWASVFERLVVQDPR